MLHLSCLQLLWASCHCPVVHKSEEMVTLSTFFVGFFAIVRAGNVSSFCPNVTTLFGGGLRDHKRRTDRVCQALFVVFLLLVLDIELSSASRQQIPFSAAFVKDFHCAALPYLDPAGLIK